uniref:Uncharacterized protein n=1 Tax=Glossina palpalis gambiensis TaxID=67801 RepID=A0A1B0C2F0_9MUSC
MINSYFIRSGKLYRLRRREIGISVAMEIKRQASKIRPNAVVAVSLIVLLTSNMNSKHSRLFNSLNVKFRNEFPLKSLESQLQLQCAGKQI